MVMPSTLERQESWKCLVLTLLASEIYAKSCIALVLVGMANTWVGGLALHEVADHCRNIVM